MMRTICVLILLLGLLPNTALAQLDSSCLISALNRTAPVETDGTWVLPNVPANLGKVRLRATCIRDGVVSSGQSEFIEVPADGVIEVAEIRFDVVELVPERLVLSAPTTSLSAAGQTVQLTATATYPGGDEVDVSSASDGTSYRSSMAAVASVDADGLVLALASGNVLVSAVNEGALGLLRLSVVLSGDSDGDGLPDDWEILNGLDPNNADDALLDHDADGLSTIEEYQLGLDPFDQDSDDDGLVDGAEVNSWGTNPLLFDTDGDGLSDGLEVQTGSDPLDPSSFNLAAALASIEVAPAAFTITFNTILGEASRRLEVTGQLIDGTSLDITSDFYGTAYASSDLTIANFGAEAGRVFAGQDGVATVTVVNNGFTADVVVTVESFSPTALSFLPLGGNPRAIAVEGDYAYVAMGRPGLKIIDVSDPESPFEAARIFPYSPPPFREYRAAEDVVVQGAFAFVAAEGLAVIDVSLPTNPEQLAFLHLTPLGARTIAVRGNLALVAGVGYQSDPGELAVVDVSDPASPALLGSVGLPGEAQDVAFAGDYAVVATGASGLQVVDLEDPAVPVVVGSLHTRSGNRSSAVGLAVAGQQVLVADGGDLSGTMARPGGLKVVDLGDPANPVVTGNTNDQFGLTHVVWDGALALSSDYFFVNGVPVFRLSDVDPVYTGLMNFSGPPSGRDDNGVDLAAAGGLVYLVAIEGRSGPGGLHIGRYLVPFDGEGVAPTVEISAPEAGTLVPEREVIVVAAEARDDIFVQSVSFLIDGEEVWTDFAAPFSARIPVPAGLSSLSLTARARDAGGNEALSAAVVLPVDPNSFPVVNLLAPIDGTTVNEGEGISIVAVASDDLEVERVEFYADGALLATDVTGPSYSVNAILGASPVPHELTAIAYDDAGASPVAGPVLVTLVADEPPQALILEPSAGTEVIALSLVEVLAGASDAVGVEHVRFYRDGSLFSVDGSGPDYRATFASPDAGLSTDLSIVVRDTAGQETSSPIVQITSIPDPGTTVTGLVVGLDDAPFESASLVVTTSENTDLLGVSGSDGSFSIEDIPTAQGELEVAAYASSGGEQLEAILSEALPPQPGEVIDVGVLALEYSVPGSMIRGRVEDEEGSPVPGATVRAHDRFQLVEVTTDSLGSFSILRFPVYSGSRFYLSAQADLSGTDYRGKLVSVFPDPFGDTDVGAIVVSPDPGGDPLTTAVGSVRDAEGEPLVGFEVVITTDSSFVAATTDAAGQYSVTGLPALDGGLVAAASGISGGAPYREANEDPAGPVAGGTTTLETLYPFGEDGGGGDG